MKGPYDAKHEAFSEAVEDTNPTYILVAIKIQKEYPNIAKWPQVEYKIRFQESNLTMNSTQLTKNLSYHN